MEDNNKKITNTGVHVSAFENFIDAVKSDSACALKFMKLPDEKCWFYRANLLVNKERVMVVLDTKAKKMDFVGSELAISSLNDRFMASIGKKPKQDAQVNKAPLKPKNINVATLNEKTRINPQAIKNEKPLNVKPSTVKSEKPINGNPTAIKSEKPINGNPTAIKNEKPINGNPTAIKNERPINGNPTAIKNENAMQTAKPFEKNGKSIGRRPMPPKDPELPDMPYLKTRLTFSEAFGYASKNLEKRETEKINEIQNSEPKTKEIIETKKIVPTTIKEQENTTLNPPYDGYTVRNYPLKSLERLLKRCEDNDRLTIKNVQTVLEGTLSEVKTYTLTDIDNNKLHVRYLPKKEMIQLQGKKTSLMEIVYSFFNDNITVVKNEEVKKPPQARAAEIKKPEPPIKQVDAKKEPANNKPFEMKKEVVAAAQTAAKQDSSAERLKAEERKDAKSKEDSKKEKLEIKELKNKTKEEKASEKEKSETLKKLHKLIPVGFDYLSDIAKKDLCSCLKDINTAVLSDYSGLLTPPYRALENLISSLQLSKGITVKMIGQGFEKEDSGKYILKSGYLKKINSIIFNEVMSALYTEYFSKRNFFSHSDNSLESQSRNISDKNEVKKIFNTLLEIIEYNCKKLDEIGAKIN